MSRRVCGGGGAYPAEGGGVVAIWGPTGISADADDGTWDGTTWSNKTSSYSTGEFFMVRRSGSSVHGALRFQNVAIPAGATINSATLTLTARFASVSINATTSIVTIYADVGSNRSAALDSAHNPGTGWTNSTANKQQAGLATSPLAVDVAAIVQELVNLGGWASGDNICLKLDPVANSGDTYWITYWVDYDADTLADVATLVVDYTEAGGSEDVAAAGSLSITGAAVLNAAGSLAAAGAASITGAADLDATGTLAAAGAVSITGAADLDAAGSLAAAGALAITGAADLDAIGNLLAAGSLEIAGAADLTGAAANDIAAAGSLSITGSADLDAIGQLLAAGSIVITGAADLTGVSANDIAASGALSITGTADLDAIGQLLAAGSIFITGIAALTSGAVETGGTPGGSGYPVYWQGKRRKRRLEDQPNLHLKKVLDDVVNELYGELTEDDVPPAVQAKAAKLVKPFVAQKDKKLAIPPPAAVDWAALERDATRVRQLIALWRKQEEDAEIEAEDEYLLLMG